LPASGIEHRLEFLDHEGNIAAAAEHGADHARECHGPRVRRRCFSSLMKISNGRRRPPSMISLSVM
jgi:hypothetical protein